jgi:hypothetical protein
VATGALEIWAGVAVAAALLLMCIIWWGDIDREHRWAEARGRWDAQWHERIMDEADEDDGRAT